MVKSINNTVNCAENCQERTCLNCAKGRITGYNHQRAPLYTCRPIAGESETMSHVVRSDCKYHQSYEEKYGSDYGTVK